MAVYTELNKQAIQGVLKEYDLGELIKFEAISSGIENTNYFIWTSKDGFENDNPAEWVLTIFENLQEGSIPFFNQLTRHLKEQGFCVPAPMFNKHGEDVFHIQTNVSNKFGVIVPRFSGTALVDTDVASCQSIAVYVAKMHLALSEFFLERKVQHSIEWCRGLIEQLEPRITQEDKELLELAFSRYCGYDALIQQCPAGIVHGDLFKDNVLFHSESVSGVIDFYHAGKTTYLFDLAVIANDWAVNVDRLPALFSEERTQSYKNKNSSGVYSGIYHAEKLHALITAYGSVKPLSDIEKQVWPRLLELAAFRFWLSRLKTKYLEGYQQDVKEGDVVKSPLVMKLILLAAMEKD